MKAGDKITSCHTRKKYEVTELGVMHPGEVPTESLRPGQVGYVACNMKESTEGNSIGIMSNTTSYSSSSYRGYSVPCGRTCACHAWFPAHESDGKSFIPRFLSTNARGAGVRWCVSGGQQ